MSEAAAPSAHVDTFSLDRLPARADWPEFLFDLPELHYPELLNASRELLEGGLEKGWGERACLISAATGETWTYADLLAHSNRLANRLVADYGLQPGNRVLLRGPNNPWLVALWFAVVRAGGVVVPTMPLLRGKELATICEIAAIDLAVCDHRFTEDLVSAEIPGLRVLTYGAAEAGSDEAGALPDITLPDITLPDITGGLEEVSADFTAVATRADDVVTLAFTSGTTGRPKATMHFHRDILANADTFSRHILKPTADDVFIGTPPIAFTFGLGGLVIFPLRVGASTVLVERATPAELAATIDRHHATVCFTAPTAYKAMLAGDVPVVSGLYFTRGYPSEPLVYRGRGNGYYGDWRIGDKVWADGVPTGCLLIHCSILRAMWKDSEEYQVSGQTLRRVFEEFRVRAERKSAVRL